VKTKKNLNRNAVRLLRKVQKFLIDEPRRFNMRFGIMDINEFSDITRDVDMMLGEPPCGTACCIAGAAYVVATNKKLNHTSIDWDEIMAGVKESAKVNFQSDIFHKLFYTKANHNLFDGMWPEFYNDMYVAAKTPLERACVGVARIEHFIATDGRE
jgi:hypothetical protein